ncbi:CBS domain-containing protein [Quadrisphaera sp. KR29]|uniref:CBS domain-containing protein n=1 Tax=Quadrisphaera sp. KR29 TaxID=3461391 RepID=UPI004044E6FA
MTMAFRFLAAFNEVENHLREKLTARHGERLSELIRWGQDEKLLTQQQSRELSTLASLRNALVHGRYINGRPLAEPVPEVVRAIERLRERLLRPAKARDVLDLARPATFAPDDLLSEVLLVAASHQYSQFPVYDAKDGYSGLLTTDGIAMWLGANLTPPGIGLVEDVPIRDLLPHVEQVDAAVFVPVTITAADAATRLQHGGQRGRPAVALLVTESGQRREPLVGLITTADLPQLLDAAG